MKKTFIIILTISFLFLGAYIGFPYYTVDTIQEGEVISKEVKKTDGEDLYLVFIRDKEGKSNTYKIEDNLWHLQYSSSNMYGQLKEGDKLKIKYYGLRIPFFSRYKNIYDVTILSNKTDDLKENLEEYTNQIMNNKDVYIYKDENIYKYNIEDKTIELYDEKIFLKVTTNNEDGEIKNEE